MLSTVIPATFTSLFCNDKSYHFNKGNEKEDREHYPVIHMSNISNNQIGNKGFDELVADTMATLFSYTVITNNTPHRITVRDRHSMVKTFNPGTDQSLKSVNIFTIYCLKNPFCNGASIGDGIENYCEAILDKYKKYTDEKLAEMKLVYSKILELAKTTTDTGYQNNITGPLTYGSKTKLHLRDYLYVVTRVQVSLESLRANQSVFAVNKDMVISLKNVLEIEDHPSLTESNPLAAIQDEVDKNLFTVVLVDNENRFSSR